MGPSPIMQFHLIWLKLPFIAKDSTICWFLWFHKDYLVDLQRGPFVNSRIMAGYLEFSHLWVYGNVRREKPPSCFRKQISCLKDGKSIDHRTSLFWKYLCQKAVPVMTVIELTGFLWLVSAAKLDWCFSNCTRLGGCFWAADVVKIPFWILSSLKPNSLFHLLPPRRWNI